MFRNFSYIFLIALFCLLKLEVLLDLGIRYTDHDQCTLWNAAVDASHGDFHEPCFYGQNYNSNLEAYLAVPLLWMKVPVHIALPVVTTLMAILIFLLPSLALFFKQKFAAAYLLIIIPIFLPADYHLVSSMPRGFITGLFLVAVGHFFYLRLSNHFGHFLLFLFITLALWINPNSLMMSMPVGLLFLLSENLRAYLPAMLGAMLASSYKLFTIHFYENHPLYIYHVKSLFEYDLENLTEGLTHLDKYFFNGTWYMLLLTVLILAIAWRSRDKRLVMMMAIYTLLFVFTLGMDRVNDGLPAIFYHHGRMYLGVVWGLSLLIVNFLPEIKMHSEQRRKQIVMSAVLMGLCVFVFVKVANTRSRIIMHTSKIDNGVVVSSVDELYRRDLSVISECLKSNVDLVVFPRNCMNCWLDTYAIPAISDGMINTLNIPEDRRGWRFEDELTRHERTFYSLSCGESERLVSPLDLPVMEPDSYLTACYILHIDTNVVDYYRSMIPNVRYGY